MKKNNAMRWAVLLLVLVLMTSCFVGATFAKYTSKAEVGATATVAKWSFTVNDKDFTKTSEALTFDLFATVNDTNGGNAETDVVAKKIAPGTTGSFALAVENTSEVNAKCSVALKVTNEKNIPLQYSVDGRTWVGSIDELALTEKAVAMNAEETFTVYWRWAFEGNNVTEADAADTKLGIDGDATVTITATLTATQVD